MWLWDQPAVPLGLPPPATQVFAECSLHAEDEDKWRSEAAPAMQAAQRWATELHRVWLAVWGSSLKGMALRLLGFVEHRV